MSHLLRFGVAALFAAALLVPIFHFAPGAHAQPALCLNLEPGEHTFEADSLDRDGTVSFRIVTGEGGEILEFYEPGGQEIGAQAGLGILSSGDYAMPDDWAIVPCAEADSLEGEEDSLEGEEDSLEGEEDSLEGEEDSLEGEEDSLEGEEDSLEGEEDSLEGESTDDAGCVNLPPGTHTVNVTYRGQDLPITAVIGEGGVIQSVDAGAFGRFEGARIADVIALVQSGIMVLPDGIELVPCDADDAMMDDDDAMMDDEAAADTDDDAHVATLYPSGGSGGLADSSTGTAPITQAATIAAVVAALAATLSLAARRRLLDR